MQKLFEAGFSELWTLAKGLQQSRKHLGRGEKKKGEILVRTVNFVAIQLALFLVPVSQQCGNPENQQSTVTVNTSSLAASGGGGTGLELLQGPIPRELSLSWSGASKKTPFARLSLSDLIWSPPTANSLWCGVGSGRAG